MADTSRDVQPTYTTPEAMASSSPAMSHAQNDVDFVQRQPSYLRATFVPASLRGYKAKYPVLPRFLDYALFGPPVIRDSSPGGMAYVFGRTEHDTQWNKKPKGSLARGMHMLVLFSAYIFFLYAPVHFIWNLGVKPYYRPNA